jgi:predicted naringenin-chalcone synthase
VSSGPAALLGLGTAVPPYRVRQAEVGRWMAASLAERPALGRWLERLYARSGITTRYTCLPDVLAPPEHSRLAPGTTPGAVLSTAERMEVYAREALPLAAAAAERALADAAAATGEEAGSVAASITHLVVVSCTGFYAPGPDLLLARQLGLSAAVERTLVGFMGCAAAFNGLRLAGHIVAAEPSARVLVVAVELCSLHLQPGSDPVQLVVASLFGDGAAAAVAGSPVESAEGLILAASASRVTPDSLGDMVWRIGDSGFILGISPDIPRAIGEAAPGMLRELLGDPSQLGFWAVHPGGRAIVDRVGQVFGLAGADLAATRTVLRDYVNISSATILFVLEELRRRLRAAGPAEPVPGVAMGFGPGLVTEMAHLVYQPAQPPGGSAGSRPGARRPAVLAARAP